MKKISLPWHGIVIDKNVEIPMRDAVRLKADRYRSRRAGKVPVIINIDPDGNDVWEVGQQQQPVPAAKGGLRASRRKLDPELSLRCRPYHAPNERQWLKPKQPVRLDVATWPNCMVFRKGHRLRLDIQPRDGAGSAPYTHYSADYNNTGENTVYTGGSMASHLLLPIVPKA